MAGNTLEKLLEQIRDGEASAKQIAEARGLAVHDGRLPEDIRGEVLIDDDDLQAEAVGLLAVLGNDDFGDLLREALSEELDVADDVMSAIANEAAPVAAAVREEAGDIEITAQTLEELGDLGVPIREAVFAEAGHVDIVAATMQALGDLGLSLNEAVAAEAGTVDLSGSVMTGLGFESLDIGASIRAEAGDIDIAVAVLTQVGGADSGLREAVMAEAGEVPDMWAGVLENIEEVEYLQGARETLVPEAPVIMFGGDETVSPTGTAAVAPAPSAYQVPAPANNNSRWAYGVGALLMAAIALLVVGPNLMPGAIGTETPIQILVADNDLVFALASDVIVENLESGDDVMVMQMMGDDGAMILWVDEGEVL